MGQRGAMPDIGAKGSVYSKTLGGWVGGYVADIDQDGMITLHYGKGVGACGETGCRKKVTLEQFGKLWRFN